MKTNTEITDQQKNKLRYVKMAIENWTNKSNGIYHWSEKERYTSEYCLSQAEFFKKMI